MAVTVNAYPPASDDQIHHITFIVRNTGSPDRPGTVDGNPSNVRGLLLTAIAAATISITGLEVVRDVP